MKQFEPIPEHDETLARKIIGAAIEVHKELGPGLLESAYEQCLCHELSLRGIQFRRQIDLPVKYKGLELDCGYKMDIVVEDVVILELKTVRKLAPVHEAQLLTYLKLYDRPVGLLINFNVALLKNGLKRMVHHFDESSASPRLCGEEIDQESLHGEPICLN